MRIGSTKASTRRWGIMLKRLDDIAPTIRSGPTISDLKYNFIAPQKQPVVALYSEYLENVIKQLEKSRPVFSKFAEYDDAIVSQVQEGMQISYSFIEAAAEAIKYKDIDAIDVLYSFFGSVLKFCSVPDDYIGSYRDTDFDGFKFLVYEMFVSFISLLIKNNGWDIIARILKNDLFIEKKYEGKYISFVRISSYNQSLDEIRNNRLNMKQTSIMADFIKVRFTSGDLSQFVSHKDFMEADYFLFMRTICHVNDSDYRSSLWSPRSCVYLERSPIYVSKAESKSFLRKISTASGFEREEEFLKVFREKYYSFRKWLPDDFLADFDFSELGTRQ